MANETSFWKRCSSCKKEIGFSTPYQVCSVSTCNRKRTGMVFCSVGCWEIHLPMMRHREAYAVEKRSPTQAAWQRELEQEGASQTRSSGSPAPARTASSASAPRVSSGASEPVRRRTPDSAPAPAPAASATSAASSDGLLDVDEADMPRDVLIVASKLKKYIRARSSFNTSDGIMSVLSDHVRAICREAIKNAAKDGRKTVLDRDIPRPPRP